MLKLGAYWLGMVAHTVNSSGRQRQADLCEFEASLIYIESSRSYLKKQQFNDFFFFFFYKFNDFLISPNDLAFIWLSWGGFGFFGNILHFLLISYQLVVRSQAILHVLHQCSHWKL